MGYQFVLLPKLYIELPLRSERLEILSRVQKMFQINSSIKMTNFVSVK